MSCRSSPAWTVDSTEESFSKEYILDLGNWIDLRKSVKLKNRSFSERLCFFLVVLAWSTFYTFQCFWTRESYPVPSTRKAPSASVPSFASHQVASLHKSNLRIDNVQKIACSHVSSCVLACWSVMWVTHCLQAEICSSVCALANKSAARNAFRTDRRRKAILLCACAIVSL